MEKKMYKGMEIYEVKVEDLNIEALNEKALRYYHCYRDDYELHLLKLEDKYLLVGIMEEDCYRSRLSFHEVKDIEVFKEVFSLEKIYSTNEDVEVLEDSSYGEHGESNDQTIFYVNGKAIFSYGDFYYDYYYYNGFVSFDKDGLSNVLTLEELKLKHEFSDLSFDEEKDSLKPITNNELSFIITGRPRIGKTTFSKRYKGKVVDTDAFESPMDIVNHIDGGICYIVGKWRNILVNVGDEMMEYDRFIAHLLSLKSLENIVLSFQDVDDETEIDKIILISYYLTPIFITDKFDISKIDGMRDVIIYDINNDAHHSEELTSLVVYMD